MRTRAASKSVAGKVFVAGEGKGSQPRVEAGLGGGAGKVFVAGEGKGSQQWAEVARLGRRQDGVFGVQQLYALGFTDPALRRCVQQGRLIRRHRGVYADGLTKPTQRGHLLGALLAVGEDAYLSRRTSLAMYAVRLVNLRQIEVTVVAEHTPRHAGIIVHRTSVVPDEHEIRIVNGLRVASPSLALVEVAARETPAELGRLIAELARQRLLDLPQIDAAIDRRRGLRGLPKLRAALARYRPTPIDRSGFERAVAGWLREHPEVPPAVRNDRIGPWEVDFHWPEQRVVMETDGERYHLTPQERERDAVKDAWLQRHGYLVLRVTEFRFAHDRPGILGDLLAMLHLHSIPA